MTSQEKYLYYELKQQRKILKSLAKFYNETMNALQLQKEGHSNGWSKVQKLSDKIEDKYDIE